MQKIETFNFLLIVILVLFIILHPATSQTANFIKMESISTALVNSSKPITIIPASSSNAALFPIHMKMHNENQEPEVNIPISIPHVDLRVGRVIKVTNSSDAQNGDVSTVEALFANPGPDGISLREAIVASNNTIDPETIEFTSELKGDSIRVGSASNEGLILTGGCLIINGDIDDDKIPDITLDGSLCITGTPLADAIIICSSHNTISSLNIVNFPGVGICLTPSSHTDPILHDNKIMRNVISGMGQFGIQTRQPGVGKEASDVGWDETLISGNIINDTKDIPIYLIAAFAGASRNRILNTTVVANHISGGKVGINVFTGDTASDWEWHPPHIRERNPVEYSDYNVVKNTLISGNVIEDVLYWGISACAGNCGNRDNIIQDINIVGNSIIRTQWRAIGIVTATESGSRTTTNNRVAEVNISQNVIKYAYTGILLGTGNSYGDYTGSDVCNNQLEDIMVKDNIVQGYENTGLLIWGGMTYTCTYNVFNNTSRRFIVQHNQFVAQMNNGETGIQVIGGWGLQDQGISHNNFVEDISILENVVYGNDVGIRLIGGKGPSARDNFVSMVVLQDNILKGNTKSIIINDNEEGAEGNSVDTLTTSIAEKQKKLLPKEFTLCQNYPNPFNSGTLIRYELSQKIHVILLITNLLGEEVVTLVDEEKNEGYYSINWNGTDRNGLRVSSGLYLYQLVAGDFVAVRKMVFTK